MEKAIITTKFIDAYGQIETINIPENMEDSFEHLRERVDDMKKRGFKRVGDMTIQFVKI